MAKPSVISQGRLAVVTPTGPTAVQYFLAFFGRPGFEDTWGWRFLGHHLSLSYTIIENSALAVTPCGMGAQPGCAGLLRPLAPEEDQAFALLGSLPAQQRNEAMIHTVAPAGDATRQLPFIGKVEYPTSSTWESRGTGSPRRTGRR